MIFMLLICSPVTAGTTSSGIDATLILGGSITGRVTDSSGTGIADVMVYASDASGGSAYGYGFSQSNGSYTIVGLPTGSYKLEFQDYSSVYVTQWYNNKASWELGESVPVTAGLTTGDINATLVMGGTIAGRVANSSGSGIAEVWVYAVDPVNGAGNGAYTQSDGIYTIIGLPTGSYKLKFYGNTTGYLTQWYNNKASSDLADAVSVTAKLTTSNIDATMIQGVYITGRVINSLNTGISDVVVTVTDTANGSTYGYVTTQSDGGYTIGLPPGSYIFTPTHQYFNFSPGNLGITVSNSDLYLGSFFGAITVPDADEDVIPDIQDNCPAIYNPDQADMNSNGLGDACDPDADSDGIPQRAGQLPDNSQRRPVRQLRRRLWRCLHSC